MQKIYLLLLGVLLVTPVFAFTQHSVPAPGVLAILTLLCIVSAVSLLGSRRRK